MFEINSNTYVSVSEFSSIAVKKAIARFYRDISFTVSESRRAGTSIVIAMDSNLKEEAWVKERLHLWRKRDIIKRTEAIAHKKGMRFSTVYASGTSKYAFDGSRAVTRDKDNHSLCTFTTGKRYN